MSNHFKRVLALLLALVMVIGMLPALAFAADDTPSEPTDEVVEVVTPEHEAELQADVLGDINIYFARLNKKSSSIDLEDYYEASDEIKAIVLASDTYVDDSLLENGDGFFWQTTTGITCGYFPQHEYEMAVMRANNAGSDGTKNASASACTNYSSSAAGDDDVCLIGPMYSEDSSFTEQYGNEARDIAAELGGTAYKLINNNASITNIADAISKCRVVIFDSHGNTDWGYFGGGSDGDGEEDCVTQANTSYLCLSTGSGITKADMTYIKSPSGHYSDEGKGYCHAYSDSEGNYVIDGTAIANHMTKNAPNSMLWMAICLGMATDGMAVPLHNKGVSVVYGYSQSVTFSGEYKYEATFWDNMIAGKTVAQSISAMKTKHGNWDPGMGCNTIAKARQDYAAFPIVVSDQDTYPGQRTSTTNYTGTVDDVQTVKSTWKLKEDLPQDPCTITLKAGTSNWRTVSTTTNTTVTLPNYTGTVPTGYTFAGWTTAAISGTTQTTPTLYNGSYSTGSATAITLYACFSKSEGSGGSGNRYTLTSNLTSGNDYIFVSSDTAGNAYALDAANMAGSPTHTTEPTAVTVSSGATPYVDLATNSTLPFHVTTDGSMGNYTKYKMTATVNGEERYLTINGNGIGYQSGYKAGWDSSKGLFGTNGKNTTCYYAYFADGNFDASSSASGRVYAYEKSGSAGTTTYTTTITVCSHTYSTAVTQPTCTEQGYTTHTCGKCGDSYKDTYTDALGHDYGAFSSNNNGKHSKTCSRCSDKVTENCSYTSSTSGATTTFTCSVCHYSYQTTKDTYTVSFRVPGFESDIAPASVIEGNSITLPTVGTVDGYTFAGWTTAAIDPESTTASTVLTGSYKPTANVTLYALYTRTEAGSGSGSSDEFTKVTSAPSDWSGDYLIVWEASATDARVFNGESGTEKFATGTISGNKITNSNDYAVVSIEKMTGGYSLYVDGKGYMKGTSGSNALSYATSAQLNTVEMDDDGVLITSNTSVLRWNNATSNGHMFRYYKSTSYGSQQPIQLYKAGAGSSSTTYYTTNPVAAVPCAHNNMETVAAVAATCTTAGNNAYYHCPDCGKYFKDAAGNTATTAAAETIAALGHDYSTTATQLDATNHKYVCSRCDAYTTEAHSFTESTEGATVTHLCTVCGYSYETTLNTYTISYYVPGFEGALAPDSVEEGNSTTLPTLSTVDCYTFAGWTTEAIDPESTTAPTVLTGSYKPTANVTLYALYTRTEAGEGGAAGYYLAAATPAIGDKIIIAIKDGDNWYCLPNGNTSGVYSITGDEFTVTNGRAVDTEDNTFVVAENKGYTGIMSTTGDYYLALNSGKLAMNGWGDTKPIAFEAGTESGTYYIVGAKSGTSGNEGRALDYSDSVFSCDGVDGGSPVYIFVYTEGGAGDTTYYTTNPTISTECQHLHTSLIGASEPTCLFDGYTGDTFCNDCFETVQTGTVIPKLGHDIVIDAAVPATCTESGLTEGQHCTRCEYATVKQNVIPALGHEYNAEGICFACGDKLIDIVSASLRLDEDIDVIYTAKVPEGATAYMTFTMNGETVTVSDDGTHTFAFEGVNPQCMGDNISAELTVSCNGFTYTCSKETYSVRQYCVNKLADSSVTGTLRTLISDVLAYGAAAQTYMSYNTSALVNSGSDVKNPTYSTFTSLSGLGASFDGTAANDVRWTAAGLTLTNNVAMTFRFYADSVDGLTVTVSINGRTQTFTASDFIDVDGKANTYEISFTGIKANEFANNVTASFARNGAQVGNSVSYSVNAYVCAKQADSDANLAALVKALYNYGDSAKAYNPA